MREMDIVIRDLSREVKEAIAEGRDADAANTLRSVLLLYRQRQTWNDIDDALDNCDLLELIRSTGETEKPTVLSCLAVALSLLHSTNEPIHLISSLSMLLHSLQAQDRYRAEAVTIVVLEVLSDILVQHGPLYDVYAKVRSINGVLEMIFSPDVLEPVSDLINELEPVGDSRLLELALTVIREYYHFDRMNGRFRCLERIHLNRLIELLKIPTLAAPCAGVLLQSTLREAFTEGEAIFLHDIGGFVETVVSAFTHQLQVSALQSRAKQTPYLGQMLVPEIGSLASLLASLLLEEIKFSHGNTTFSNHRALNFMIGRRVEATFSFLHDWKRHGDLAAMALSLGLSSLVSLLRQEGFGFSSLAAISIPGFVVVASVAKGDLHIGTDVDGFTALSVGAINGMHMVSLKVDDLPPQKARITNKCRVLLCRRGVEASQITIENEIAVAVATTASSCSINGSRMSSDVASESSPLAQTELCARCSEVLAKRMAASEGRCQVAERQRDELLDCVSSLRHDVEITASHVVEPLQAEVRSLRQRLAESQSEMSLAKEVIKQLLVEIQSAQVDGVRESERVRKLLQTIDI